MCAQKHHIVHLPATPFQKNITLLHHSLGVQVIHRPWQHCTQTKVQILYIMPVTDPTNQCHHLVHDHLRPGTTGNIIGTNQYQYQHWPLHAIKMVCMLGQTAAQICTRMHKRLDIFNVLLNTTAHRVTKQAHLQP